MSTETKQLPLRLPKPTYDALKTTAFFTERSMNDIVTVALQQYLDTEGRAALLAASVQKARTRYRDVLDKLA
jgi:hypothetical protein